MAFPVERARTAILFGLLFVVMLFAHRWSYIIVWCIILCISLFELNRMTGLASRRFSILVFGLLPSLLAIYHFELGQAVLDLKYVQAFLGAELLLLIVLIIDLLFFEKSKLMLRLPSLLSLLFIGNAVALLIIIRPTNMLGVKLVFALLVIIWAADVGAYFAGKKFGRNKLIPWVSPNKTWQGLIGGIIAAVVLGQIIFIVMPIGQWYNWLILSIIISVAGLFGDLIESRLKRLTGHKDSGTLLPGHGGMLDRFDAVFGFIPFAFLYLYWLDIIHF